MLLVADIGNSNSVFGLYDDSRLIRRWRITTVERTADEYELMLDGLLAGDAASLSGAALASVVPHATEVLRSTLLRMIGATVVVVGPGTRTGMQISVDNPREVGADRIATAVGASDRYGTPVVTVDFGTAITVDLVSPSGAYLGGAIAPGPRVGAEALVESTSALRRVELAVPDHAVGRSTSEAMQSGLIYGSAALVDGLVGRFVAEHGLPGDTPVVATGGLATILAPLTSSIARTDDDLTLWGLKVIFDRNSV
jgi:type III pantothenate kinase